MGQAAGCIFVRSFQAGWGKVTRISSMLGSIGGKEGPS